MPPQPANLIVLLTDNHARSTAGCYGHPVVLTPNLDKLARSGTKFLNAYCASPLCCPARASIATGLYPHQSGYWDNVIAYDGKIESWMHALRNAGHTVVSVGKLHFRSSEDDNGFSEEIEAMHLLDGKGAVKNLMRGFDAEKPKNDSSFTDLYIKKSGVGNSDYLEYDRRITKAAKKWLARHADKHKKPWVLFASYISPHPPFVVPEHIASSYSESDIQIPRSFGSEFRSTHPSARYLSEIEQLDKVSAEDIRLVIRNYFGSITHADEQIGELLSEVESLGLMHNTRFIYTSDHGELFGQHGLLGKKSLLEDSVGVPLLISGPGVPRDQSIRQVVSHVDLYPTIIELVTAELGTVESKTKRPGVNLLGHQHSQFPSRIGFAEYHGHGSKSAAYMIRKGMHKLIYHVGMPSQLFDLNKNPDETEDLAERGASTMELETELRKICNPETVDKTAKLAQRKTAERYGGIKAIMSSDNIVFTPPPTAKQADSAV